MFVKDRFIGLYKCYSVFRTNQILILKGDSVYERIHGRERIYGICERKLHAVCKRDGLCGLYGGIVGMLWNTGCKCPEDIKSKRDVLEGISE